MREVGSGAFCLCFALNFNVMRFSSDVVAEIAVSTEGHPRLKKTCNIKLDNTPALTNVCRHSKSGH